METIPEQSRDLIAIVQKRVAGNRDTTNKEIAEHASRDLNRKVSPTEVSKVREALGISRDDIKGEDLARWYARQQIDRFAGTKPYTSRRFPVQDLDRSIGFYAMLGFATMRHEFVDPGMALGYDQFTFIELPVGTPLMESGITDIPSLTYTVFNLESYSKHLANHGYVFFDREASGDRLREFILSDPDGRIIIVSESLQKAVDSEV